MERRIRVVFFHIASGSFGGGSKMLLRLLCSLDRDRFEPILVSNREDELCRRADGHGIDVTIVPFHGALDTFDRQLLSRSYLLVPAGVRILQFNSDIVPTLSDADIIWCENLRAVLTLFPYLAISQSPAVWNVGLGLKPTGKVKYLKSLALQVVDYVFIESQKQALNVFTQKQYSRHKRSFITFHKGIDTQEFSPVHSEQINKKGRFKIGTAASLTPRKGLEYVIEAMPEIIQAHDDTKLFIAGDISEGNKEYIQKLNNQIEQHGIVEQVEFTGWVDNMPKYLNTLDVFILPSLNEGIPGAVREALAVEVPVVATDVGGTSEAVIEGETGFLVDPRNSEQLADRVIRLLNNSEMRRQMGKNGRNHIKKNFSIESYVQKYENFLVDIAGT